MRCAMKIQLLIAVADSDYSEYLSNTLSTKYTDKFAVGLCSSQDKLSDVLSAKKYDVILVEPEWISMLHKHNLKLVLALICEESSIPESALNAVQVEKYQRISTLVNKILELYEKVAPSFDDLRKSREQIVAVWSPVGGVGKTSVALAYATRAVSNGGIATYLSFEQFSSAVTYFSVEGGSISALFERLTSNAELNVKSFLRHDNGSGVDYFCPPENYNDINKLSKDDMVFLVNTCARACDVAVVDLPSICDKNSQAVLELADIVLLVTDGCKASSSKLDIFISQHGIFESIKHKVRLISNKGAMITDTRFEKVISLPRVQLDDPISVYKTLSGNSFDV